MKLKEPLHIIIDGPDGIGKTTVIQILSRMLSLPVIKMPRMTTKTEDGEEFTSDITKMSQFFNEVIIQFNEYDFILDRGITSSIVYDTVFHREQLEPQFIDNILSILQPKVFILDGERPKVLDGIQDVNDKWQSIRNTFLKLVDRYNFHSVYVESKSPTQICNEILENL